MTQIYFRFRSFVVQLFRDDRTMTDRIHRKRQSLRDSVAFRLFSEDSNVFNIDFRP